MSTDALSPPVTTRGVTIFRPPDEPDGLGARRSAALHLFTAVLGFKCAGLSNQHPQTAQITRIPQILVTASAPLLCFFNQLESDT